MEDWGFEAPSTKSAVRKLDALGAQGRILVVLERDDVAAVKSFRNLQRVHTVPADQLNTYDVLVSDVVVFTSASLAEVNRP